VGQIGAKYSVYPAFLSICPYADGVISTLFATSAWVSPLLSLIFLILSANFIV
jgi:hypothetical protein